MYESLEALLSDQGRYQKWLAIHLNRSQNTVSSWCANHTQPTVEDLFSIGKLLGINPKDLLIDNKYTNKNEWQ